MKKQNKNQDPVEELLDNTNFAVFGASGSGKPDHTNWRIWVEKYIEQSGGRHGKAKKATS